VIGLSFSQEVIFYPISKMLILKLTKFILLYLKGILIYLSVLPDSEIGKQNKWSGEVEATKLAPSEK
jgi:hypothetical protein